MSSSDLCSMVNILTRAYCDLKMNNSSADKNQLLFQTDFYANKRIILASLVNYEYTTNSNITISRDELAIIREFLLTYITKFTSNTINDVYIHYTGGCLIYSFVSYERSAVIADSSQTIKDIQNDIATNYENNIFKVIDDPKSLPKDQYKVPLDEFEKKTKTNFKFLRREIDDLFHTQILSGNLEQDIWIFIPKELR